MDITDINWFVFLLCIGITGVIVFLLLRRYVFGIFDPWIMQILEQTMILGGLAYYTKTGQMQVGHFIYVLAGFFFFLGGLSVFYKKKFEPISVKSMFSPSRLHLGGMQIFYPETSQPVRTKTLLSPGSLRLAILMLLALYIADNLIIYTLLGIPALRPGARTISMYASLGHGYGVLHYVNVGIGLLLPILAMKALLMYKQKFLGILSLFIIVVLTVLTSSSKTAFLSLFFIFGISAYYLGINYKMSIKVPKFFWPLLMVLAVVVAWSFVNVAQSGYEKTVFGSFVRRWINCAAGLYYYFVRGSYQGYTGLNLLSYHFSQITPYLGYTDLESTRLGVNLTLLSDLRIGTPGFGPTPSMYVVGHIAWGVWGMVYCFIIGMVLSFVRFHLKAGFVVWVALNTLVSTLTGDGTLFVLYLFYMALLSPILIVAHIIHNSAITARESLICEKTIA